MVSVLGSFVGVFLGWRQTECDPTVHISFTILCLTTYLSIKWTRCPGEHSLNAHLFKIYRKLQFWKITHNAIRWGLTIKRWCFLFGTGFLIFFPYFFIISTLWQQLTLVWKQNNKSPQSFKCEIKEKLSQIFRAVFPFPFKVNRE